MVEKPSRPEPPLQFGRERVLQESFGCKKRRRGEGSKLTKSKVPGREGGGQEEAVEGKRGRTWLEKIDAKKVL